MNPSTLKNAASEDKSAKKELFESNYSKFHAISMRYTDNDQDASNLTTESYIKIFSDFNSGIPEDFKEWGRSIFLDTCINYIKNKEEFICVDVKDQELNTNEIDSDLAMKLVRELPSVARAIFNMSVVDGFTLKEASDRLGIERGELEIQLSRAKNLLKYKIEYGTRGKGGIGCCRESKRNR